MWWEIKELATNSKSLEEGIPLCVDEMEVLIDDTQKKLLSI